MKNNLLILVFLVALTSSCQKKTNPTPATSKGALTNKQQPMTTTELKTSFSWEEGLNAPLGYPIEVYRGGLELETGFVGLSGEGTTTGFEGWGTDANGASYGEKSLPKRIHCIWLSYAEDCFYEIDCNVDYDKMLRLFNEGYIEKNVQGRDVVTYGKIMTGFAPGGVVVLWVSGAGKKVEIGRYQGKETTIPAAEIASLDSHEHLLFDPVDRKRTLENPMIIPLEVQTANKNKPIPYGLWDTYRKRYSWRPVFVIQEGGKMNEDAGFETINGEVESLIYELFTNNEYSPRAIPSGLGFSWWDKDGQGYGAYVKFDEKEMADAFAAVYKDHRNSDVDIEIKVNKINSYFTVRLKGNGKEIPVWEKNKIEVYKSEGLTAKYKKE
jgi:Protein of unknown function (DUF2931)